MSNYPSDLLHGCLRDKRLKQRAFGTYCVYCKETFSVQQNKVKIMRAIKPVNRKRRFTLHGYCCDECAKTNQTRIDSWARFISNT